MVHRGKYKEERRERGLALFQEQEDKKEKDRIKEPQRNLREEKLKRQMRQQQ
jgi:hypothetical protein